MELSLLNFKNVRLSITGEYFSQLLVVLKQLGLAYRFYSIPNKSGRHWIENEYCRLAVLSRFKHKTKAFKIFITPKYKIHHHYRWVDKRSCKEIDGKYYDQLEEIKIYGQSFPVPCHTEEYLKFRFGESFFFYLFCFNAKLVPNSRKIRFLQFKYFRFLFNFR